MNINKYTEKAREAVATALDLAAQANNPNVEPDHLLVALLEQRDGIVPEIVRKLNADPAQMAREMPLGDEVAERALWQGRSVPRQQRERRRERVDQRVRQHRECETQSGEHRLRERARIDD